MEHRTRAARAPPPQSRQPDHGWLGLPWLAAQRTRRHCRRSPVRAHHPRSGARSCRCGGGVPNGSSRPPHRDCGGQCPHTPRILRRPQPTPKRA
ncbi:hypothetical protein ACFPRL_03850 [Pseudoclavibacter helvolus]